jgi:hypothetical protein
MYNIRDSSVFFSRLGEIIPEGLDEQYGEFNSQDLGRFLEAPSLVLGYLPAPYFNH